MNRFFIMIVCWLFYFLFWLNVVIMNDDILDVVKYGDFEVFSGDNYEVFLLELKLEGFDFDFDNFLFEMVVLDFDIILI